MSNKYRESGVDIVAGDEFVEKILPYAKATYRPDVLSGIGGFAAHVALDPDGMECPVIVSSTDGVGTKLKLAAELGVLDTIGIDLVAMCVNDVCCSGARPLFFLDYFAAGKLVPTVHSRIIKGIADGCRIAGCSLVGGETAELPGIYHGSDFDLAGFSVGVVDRRRIIDGSGISAGNTIIGIASSGVHSNGYSLVRKICADKKLDLSADFSHTGKTLGEVLLMPTKIYSGIVQKLCRDFAISGIAHITGGGLVGNVPRILPKRCQARISLASWERPEIFAFLQKMGNVSEAEMQRVFNLGIGMAVIIPASLTLDICGALRTLGEIAHVIGEIAERGGSEPEIVVE
jgi:phosphoribosylformylglycinamidine cyclo-ligase